ncbi:histidine phosphatase family protein [Bdellovibrio sp. HCB337]|uniref:histidine phosphatase family protein n=1 Tax=Bdellovibrio sp. HCB337 TaxID=3394358 RepID=UPI0039A64C18
MTKTLYLVRHGITDWNMQRKMQGHTNIPLNEEGRSQAQTLQKFFQQHSMDKIFSSDLDRAFQTAQISTQSENIIKMPGLREVLLGDIEGKTETEVVAQYGRDAWEKWISLEPHANFAFPGGETHHESLHRFKTHLEDIFRKHEFKKAAVYTHGLMIRRLGHHLCPDRTEMLPIPNCGVFELHWKEETLSFQGMVFQP